MWPLSRPLTARPRSGTQQIAETLFLSPRTVSTHITNIHTKLKVDFRTAAVSYATRQGLA